MPDKRVLLIENDSRVLNVLGLIFRKEGCYTVIPAESCDQAILLLNKFNFDLISLDLHLPDKHGNEFLALLARRDITIPVIVISSELQGLMPTDLVKRVISKPIVYKELLQFFNEIVPK